MENDHMHYFKNAQVYGDKLIPSSIIEDNYCKQMPELGGRFDKNYSMEIPWKMRKLIFAFSE